MHLDPHVPTDSFPEHASTHWLVDSAATSHMTNTSAMIQQPTTYAGNDQVYMGNGSTYLEDDHGRSG